MDKASDEVIALSVQDGNSEAFGFLVERYAAKLKRYAKRFLFDSNDCDDLVQDTFLRAYQNIQSFDPNRKFSPWIYRIAHNIFVNALKQKQHLPITLFDPDLIFPHLVAPETADTLAVQHEVRELLNQHLSLLEQKYREPLILFFYEELNYQEIADILEMPVSTVGVRINRGKAQLRAMMNKKNL